MAGSADYWTRAPLLVSLEGSLKTPIALSHRNAMRCLTHARGSRTNAPSLTGDKRLAIDDFLLPSGRHRIAHCADEDLGPELHVIAGV